MDKVRIGLIGYGNIAGNHMRDFDEGLIPNGVVTAVYDIDKEKTQQIKDKYEGAIVAFDDEDEFFNSELFEAIFICTPHYSHPYYAIKAFKKGMHVLCEKPAGVYTKQVREMNEEYEKHTGLVFSMMYNQRTNPVYAKVREIVQSGEMGNLRRSVWIITDWFRSQKYFDSGGWRATWAEEGGGALLNQNPHQLDLWQWICGMPVSVQAHMGMGKFHNIEVEDDVTAYVEYENGATGVFITSTGEAPGTNRLELSLDYGKIVVEKDIVSIWKLEQDINEFIDTTDKIFGAPKNEFSTLEINEENPRHKGITRNFVNTILKKEELIAPGEEGINGLMLSNAMHLSHWTNEKIQLPVDEDLYYDMLQEKIQSSTIVKKQVKSEKVNLDGTF